MVGPGDQIGELAFCLPQTPVDVTHVTEHILQLILSSSKHGGSRLEYLGDDAQKERQGFPRCVPLNFYGVPTGGTARGGQGRGSYAMWAPAVDYSTNERISITPSYVPSFTINLNTSGRA